MGASEWYLKKREEKRKKYKATCKMRKGYNNTHAYLSPTFLGPQCPIFESSHCQ